MLFNVFDARVFADIKTVNAVVLRIVRAAVVDTAAGNDRNVAVVADEEVVVNGLFNAALVDYNGNVQVLALGAGFYEDVDTGAVFL